MNFKVFLKNKACTVNIEKGELISLKKDEKEYIHQKGNKGWRNADDEMFPVIGPTSKNNFRVHTKNGDAILDQHGLLRELEYSLISSDENSAKFIKKYKNNTLINNSKFPKKSTEQNLSWPFDFTFEKNFTLENDVLNIEFIINSDKGMPFMLGYHPAFLLSNTGKETLISNGTEVTLADVYKAGANACPILNSDKIILKNIDKNDLEITTKNFNNFMLWTEVDNMLCIEPITQYTSYTDQKFSEENMRLSEGKNTFSVTIKVL
ncbi:aldose 1-epimerase [Polaribacter atrinae]|uniref:aldose 1-epimerase n=1 Tax=Polaribacter atrinae TaxID=1333662 RepID=UPI002492A582|nr:aldose 1-epimerase [Polaribacter atrinae]